MLLFALTLRLVRKVTPFERKPLLVSAAQCFFAASFMGLSIAILRPHVYFAALMPLGAIEYLLVLVGVGGITWHEVKDVMDVFLKRGKKFSDIVAT
jgi:hypothetical protein